VGGSVTRVLVVAATDKELAMGDGWMTLRCGVGPVDAAAATASAIARATPALIVHVGIAGARRAAGLPPLSLVIGNESRYCDLSVPPRLAPSVIEVSTELVAAARRALPEAVVRPIGTSGTIGGTSGCDVEAMEGFGVLRAAQLAGLPAIEVRAISNAIEDQDRSLWRFDDAFAAVTAATPRLVRELSRA
jgi:nucleoside phosphorylase